MHDSNQQPTTNNQHPTQSNSVYCTLSKALSYSSVLRTVTFSTASPPFLQFHHLNPTTSSTPSHLPLPIRRDYYSQSFETSTSSRICSLQSKERHLLAPKCVRYLLSSSYLDGRCVPQIHPPPVRHFRNLPQPYTRRSHDIAPIPL